MIWENAPRAASQIDQEESRTSLNKRIYKVPRVMCKSKSPDNQPYVRIANLRSRSIASVGKANDPVVRKNRPMTRKERAAVEEVSK